MLYGATLTSTSSGYLQFSYAIGGGTTNTPGLLPGSYSDIFSTQTTDYGIQNGPTGNYGMNWVQNTSVVSTNWGDVSMSASGQYQLVTLGPGNFLYISSNYGVTWTSTGSTGSWNTVAISASGQYQIAGPSNGNIYISSNYGSTWTSTNTGVGNKNYSGIAISASGQYQTAIGVNFIYISSDYGKNWILTVSSLASGFVAMSASGQYQTAVVTGGYIYISRNYGLTWSQDTSVGSIYDWLGVAMSASGQYQIASILGGNIYISTNYGVTWTSTASSQNWRGVSMSASGQYQVGVVSSTGNIYISSNFGTTWTSTNTGVGGKNWQSVAMSASGQYITAVPQASGECIYTCYNSINMPGVINVGGYSGTISGVTGIAGSIFYDTTTSTLKYTTGTTWRDISSLSSSGFTTGGNIYAAGATFSGTVTANTFNALSDYRIKENVQNIDLTHYNVNNLRPVNYYNKILKKPDIGFIAHEVQEEFPFLVSGDKDAESYQSLNYTGLIGLAIQEIKDLKEQTKKMNHLLELNEKLVSLGDIDLCGNYLTNIEGFHFMDGSIQNTGYNTTTQTTVDTNVDIYEIKKNNNYINKSPNGFITWNIYVDNFTSTHDGTIFYFINSTGNTQDFYFKGDANLMLYDIDNRKLDVTNKITIESTRINILYINNGTPQIEMYILNK